MTGPAPRSRTPMQGDGRQRRAAASVAAAVGTAIVIAYFLLPTTQDQDIVYAGLGFVSTLVMAVGIRVNRPTDRLSWWLLVGADAATSIGDFIENIVYGMVLHRDVPVPCIADLFYLVAYPMIFLGLIGVCRTRQEGAQRENYADAAIVALAFMAVSWHFVMGGDVRAHLPLFGKVVVLLYPLMDIGLLFIVMRSLAFGSGRLPFHRVIAAAIACTLVSDCAYDYMVQRNAYATGNIVDAGWLLNYVLMAVAALHPTMVGTSEARPFDPASRRRLPLLATAGFAAPAILLIVSLAGGEVDTPVIAATSIIVVALVTMRMSWLFQNIRGHTLRARADAAALAEALQARDRLETDLRHQAFHDPLTGLANRALLYERVTQSLAAGAERAGKVGLCFCDLDGFKLVNDSLGHHAGDELLTVVSQRLQSLVRSTDTVARLGGDEFAVLLDGVDCEDVARRIAGRIVSAMREPVDIAGRQIALSVSVGVAFADPRTSTEQLLSEADVAMYEAKARGKSRWETYQRSMHSKSLERLELANAFRGSLERGEFRLQFQPQYSLATGRVEGFESLVRWAHPTRGLVAPGKFIPLAEETGFVIPLGRWVLERSCEVAAEWARTHPDLTISVNISGRQLDDPNLVDDVRTTLALTGLAPDRLTLEVTESSVVADSEETLDTIRRLKETGVRIGLDDFGTGYSSLSYLRLLPLDVLKIDKSFVDPLATGGAQERALVATIVEFASVLGLQTVAEGVEDEVQLAQLRGLGCSSVQGFLLSRPLDGADVTRLLARSLEGATSHD